MILAWLSSLTCKAHDDVAVRTARSELAHFAHPLQLASSAPSEAFTYAPPPSLWLRVAASTSAAFAASIALTQAYASRRERPSLHDVSLGVHVRGGADARSVGAGQRELMKRVNDVCLASKVAAAGATLLIWLTSKSESQPRQSRTLVGPMVLRGMNGGGLVLREKF
jgi:hypothetical protein